MSNVGKATDGMLDTISGLQHRIDATISEIEKAMIERPGDPLLDVLWLLLK